MAPSASSLLKFHRNIISTISSVETDDLLIMAKGLGLTKKIICTLLKIYDGEKNLVLIINTLPSEEAFLGEQLSTMGVKRPGLRTVSHEFDSDARARLYVEGGLLSITSRILVVDLLTQNIPTAMITGIVVLHAEKVSPTSLEAFIVRLYRETNHNGFVKAFSDEPESFVTKSLSPLQMTLRLLQIRRVHLYPRFHQEVQDSLGQRKSDVVELHQPLTAAMKEVQTCIYECMEATLNELKRTCKEIEVEDVTIDNALFRSFDRIIRVQLDPIWHRVSPKTKKLVSDLRMLRQLLAYLLSYDSVTFLSFLESILASNTPDSTKIRSLTASKQQQSPWLFLDAANTLFHVAKRRAYIPAPSKKKRIGSVAPNGDNHEEELGDEEDVLKEIQREDELRASSVDSPWPTGVEPVLEELPKWGLLASILEEIEESLSVESTVDLTTSGTNTILVMASTDRTCSQLREYLARRDPFPSQDSSPGRRVMESLLKTYFWWKGGLGDMSRNLGSSRTGGQSRPVTANALATSSSSSHSKRPNGQPDYKRRRVRGGSVAAAVTRPTTIAAKKGKDGVDEEVEAGGELEEEAGEIADFLRHASQFSTPAPESSGPPPLPDTPGNVLPQRQTSSAPPPTPQTHLRPSAQNSTTETFNEVEFNEFFGLLPPEQMIVVRPYKGEDDDQVLEELRPRFIVMYDPDPSFIRRVESFRSANPGFGIRVYFMIYSDSVEEQKYLSGIRKEKNAFEKMIREKGSMLLPISSNPRGTPTPSTSGLAAAINTRIAGGAAAAKEAEPPQVIVDMREFRSTLPSLVHASGLKIVPVTLSVGDYVLTPTMVVERKSLPDLIQSFNSGRLYTQCESMSTHYKQPILLIEFEENKSFSLHSLLETTAKPWEKEKADKNGQLSDHDVQSKLVLLTLSFPRLRIIWSSSPFATADIFKDLKSQHPEPSADRAVMIGAGDGDTDDPGVYNLPAQELLRSIPGVTSKSYKHIMTKVGSVKEFVNLNLQDMQAASYPSQIEFLERVLL